MLHGEKSVTETLLRILLYKTHSFKEIRAIAKKINSFEDVSDSSIRVTLSRLKKKGLVKRTSQGWSSSVLAEKYLKKPKKFSKTKFRKNIKSKDQMILIYDIPEAMKRERNWLRRELRVMDFKQIQLSVWLGPAPLPKEFVEALGNMRIIKFLNFFRAREEDVV